MIPIDMKLQELIDFLERGAMKDNKCKSCSQLKEKLKKQHKMLLMAAKKVKGKTKTIIKTTSKNFKFSVLSETSVKDFTTGLTWTLQKDFKGNHLASTKKFGDSLPTKKEFEVAESHGIRDVLDMKNQWFWSSSVNPNNTDFAYFFYGLYGDVHYGGRSSRYGAAVCVSGRSGI